MFSEPRTGNHLSILLVCMCPLQHLQTRVDCGNGQKRLWRDCGIYDGMRIGLQGITTSWSFVELDFSVQQWYSSVLAGEHSYGTNRSNWPWVMGFNETFSSMILVLDLLHDGNGLLLLLFFLLHYRRSFESEQIGGWTSFFSTSQRFRRTLHLMARLCSMIAWNGLIFHDGVAIALGWHGQKIIFLSWSNVPLVAIKRGG
jgi:hypothetical protein